MLENLTIFFTRGIILKNYLSIGDMSKLTNVSIQTLRYYDKINLFKPEYTNPENQYRYYSVKQIFYLDIIKYLKHIGIPLIEIQRMTKLPPESMFDFLDKQESTIEEEIVKLKNIKQLLNQRKNQLREQFFLKNQEHGVVYTRQIEKRAVLKLNCEDIVTPLDNPDVYFRKLADVLEKAGTVADNLYGCIYPMKEYKSSVEIQYSNLFTSISKTDLGSIPKNVSIDVIPKGMYMCISFKWSTTDYFNHFNELKKFYYSRGYKGEKDVFEVSLPNNYASSSEEDFISELQILIE